jgi:uncharacterized protein (DUF169 family)
MDKTLQTRFIASLNKYFNAAELPLAFYYSEGPVSAERVSAPSARMCMIGVLARARKGASLCFESGTIGCTGGRRYAGFSDELRQGFEYFLSCGVPGEMEGERYKKSPKLVREMLRIAPKFKAPAPYIVFKRFDLLEEPESPDAVIFFASPDVLSGLFTLANFDETEPNRVFCPFSAGCGRAVSLPGKRLEAAKGRDRNVRCLGKTFCPEGNAGLCRADQ